MSATAQQRQPDDEAIQALVARLSRPHGKGGHVIERAAILAAGPDSAAIEAWILAHAGKPELTETTSAPGLHGDRQDQAAGHGRARRFVLPRGVL
jgi:hypothetical protein